MEVKNKIKTTQIETKKRYLNDMRERKERRNHTIDYVGTKQKMGEIRATTISDNRFRDR